LKSLIDDIKILTINKRNSKEITQMCNNALRSIYEIATGLRNFSVMNGLAIDKIISKCNKHLPEFSKQVNLPTSEEIEKFFSETGK
jgi:SPX domain protein involved in polyphosphate accumulation